MMNLIFCPRLRVTRKLRIVTYVNYIFSLGYNTPSFSIQHFGQGGEDMQTNIGNISKILNMVKEVKETPDIKTAIQLLSDGKWIAVGANDKKGTIILGRID